MQLQTFQGSTMAEALQRVKTTLGLDAVILHTRTISGRRWMGLKKTETYEITAGRGVKRRRNASSRHEPRTGPDPSADRALPAGGSCRPGVPPTAGLAAVRSCPPKTLMDTPAVSNVAMMAVTREVKQLTEMMTDLVKVVRFQPAAPSARRTLRAIPGPDRETWSPRNWRSRCTKSLHKELAPEALAN